MDGSQLLKNYIAYITRLKEELSLDSVIYAIKPQAEIGHREPHFDLPIPKDWPIPAEAHNSEKMIKFLRNGEAVYYKIYQMGIYQTDMIFVAVLCRKTSEGRPGEKNYYNDRKTYHFITNSKEVANGKYQGLFRDYDVLTIDKVIKELERLDIPNLKR